MSIYRWICIFDIYGNHIRIVSMHLCIFLGRISWFTPSTCKRDRNIRETFFNHLLYLFEIIIGNAYQSFLLSTCLPVFFVPIRMESTKRRSKYLVWEMCFLVSHLQYANQLFFCAITKTSQTTKDYIVLSSDVLDKVIRQYTSFLHL